MRLSLQHKLLGSFIVVVALMLAIVSAGVSVLIRDYFIATKQREFTDKAFETARVVESYYAGKINFNQLTGFINSIDSLLGARVWVLDASQNLIAASEEKQAMPPVGRSPRAGMQKKSPLGPAGDTHQGMHQGMFNGNRMQRGMGEQPLPQDNSGPQQPVRKLADIRGLDIIKQQLETTGGGAWAKTFYHPYYEENMLVVGVPLQPSGQEPGTVLIHAPLSGFDSFLNRIYYYIAAAGVVAVLITIFIANYLATGITRPLKSMQAVASSMADGNYSVEAKVSTNDEVGDLSRSLNSLAAALRAFVSKTEKTDKLRRDFVANVSHELRTPLTIMRGYNEALLDGTVDNPEQAAKYHQIMRDEAVRLEKLIAELLDLSQLETRTLALETQPIAIPEVVDNIATLFNQRSVEKGVTLITNIAEGVPEICGNGDRLAQLVVILLDNALKFTPAGGTVTLGVTAETDWVTLVVSDTGSGIPEEDLPYVWERFYKGDKAHTRADGGTGLGLAIAKEIIHLHNAVPDVKSTLGQGTVFTVKFPIHTV